MQKENMKGEAKRQKHVPNEIEQLDNAVGHLSSLIDEFAVKISTVLTSEPPEEAKKQTEVAPSVVVLASEIRELKWRIDSIIRVVESMHRRLEL